MNSKANLKTCGVIFDIEKKEKRLAEIEQIIAKEGFWDNPDETKSILKKRTSLSGKIDDFYKLAEELEDNEVLLDLAIEESDEDTLQEASQQLSAIENKIDALSLNVMLGIVGRGY